MSLWSIFRKKATGEKAVPIAWYSGSPSPTDIAALSAGTQKTVVLELCCGACAKEWQDAVLPNKLTRLPCPNCRVINEITYKLSVVMF